MVVGCKTHHEVDALQVEKPWKPQDLTFSSFFPPHLSGLNEPRGKEKAVVQADEEESVKEKI